MQGKRSEHSKLGDDTVLAALDAIGTPFATRVWGSQDACDQNLGKSHSKSTDRNLAMLAATKSDSNSFTIRTVHGDSMVISKDLLSRWAYFRTVQREKTEK
ncbi:MAG: hypothetical protein Aurels2KO_41450 [Aureliella sp.]